MQKSRAESQVSGGHPTQETVLVHWPHAVHIGGNKPTANHEEAMETLGLHQLQLQVIDLRNKRLPPPFPSIGRWGAGTQVRIASSSNQTFYT